MTVLVETGWRLMVASCCTDVCSFSKGCGCAEKIAAALAVCEADRLEQARLNGMGSEREAIVRLLQNGIDTNDATMRLHMGEATAQELRTARAWLGYMLAQVTAMSDRPNTDAQGIAWFERTFGVPLGDKPGEQDVAACRARAKDGEEG